MLKVSASPHVRHHDSTATIMRDVCIALVPAVIAATILFGQQALALITVTVLASVVFEYLSRKLMGRENSIGDWSAVVTGLLLALNLPATVPLWIAIVGAFFAIVIVKQFFGGLGKNFLNPALGARVILGISFPAQMNTFTMKVSHFGSSFLDSSDLISRPTPLCCPLRSMDTVSGATGTMEGMFEPYTYTGMFLGLKPGAIGEVCILALTIGVLYLLARRVIDLYTPVAFIATTLIFVTIAGEDPLLHLLSGGLFLGAFFMANDYVTSPQIPTGQIIYGIGCGLITGLLRVYGSAGEGVSYAILLMNILVPHIDKLTVEMPRRRKRKAFAKANEA